jgi:hypothetical protein
MDTKNRKPAFSALSAKIVQTCISTQTVMRNAAKLVRVGMRVFVEL